MSRLDPQSVPVHESDEGVRPRAVYSRNEIGGSGYVHFGDVHQHQIFNTGTSSTTAPKLSECFKFVTPIGLCLDQAPHIDSSLFIGRDSEISEIHDVLKQRPQEQQRLVLGGIGGVGKTQLAIAYAKRNHSDYASVLWFNATSETTCAASFRSMAERIFDLPEIQHVTGEQLVVHLKRWLSDANNTKWLLIFDNYDEPDSYDIQTYFPYTSHGVIIITTRLPDQVNGHRVNIQPLKDVDVGLRILETRSRRRGLRDDIHAYRLAQQLAGLPLALATAGAFLSKSTWSFQRYLREYETRWNIDPRRPVLLSEYPGRTFYTTWDLSYVQLTNRDPEAAQMLKLLAYFDHQSFWYELFEAGIQDDPPEWLAAVAADAVSFESVMRVLVDYCFIEVQSPNEQAFSMHECVHNWTLARFHSQNDSQSYWYAFACVARSIQYREESGYEGSQLAPVTPHALRLTHSSFHAMICEIAEDHIGSAEDIANLLEGQLQHAAAQLISQQILSWKEKMLGCAHESTMKTAYALGFLYRAQQMQTEAERQLVSVLANCEKTVGHDDELTLHACLELGLLFCDQGKLSEAEQMITRVMIAREKANGPNHLYTLESVHNLGYILHMQGRISEAESMYRRALVGGEKVPGFDAERTIHTIQGLSLLYRDQGKLAEAEEMQIRALHWRQKVLGKENPLTLYSLLLQGDLYVLQGEMEKARRCYAEAEHSLRSILRTTKSPPPMVRGYYALVLSQGVSWDPNAASSSSSGGRLQLFELIQHFHHWGKHDIGIAHCLARALLSAQDLENAQLTLRHFAAHQQSAVFDFHRFKCDACHHRLNIDVGQHVCRRCLNVDLCDACMTKHTANTLPFCVKLRHCHDHEFYDFGAIWRETLNTHGTEDIGEMDAWIDSLKKKYAVSTSGS